MHAIYFYSNEIFFFRPYFSYYLTYSILIDDFNKEKKNTYITHMNHRTTQQTTTTDKNMNECKYLKDFVIVASIETIIVAMEVT